MSAKNSDIRAALVGSGIAGSKTPAMHEAEGRAQGLSYGYELFDIGLPEYRDLSLSQLIDMAAARGYRGLNITHPFKVEVVPLLDELSDDAQEIGAVNTVTFRDGKRIGYNTDYSGFKRAFQNAMGDVPRDDVVLLGAGGAGAAVALALIDSSVERLIVFDTDDAAAQRLVARLRRLRPKASVRTVQDLARIDWHFSDGVVNTTPVGMKSHPGTPISPTYLTSHLWVFDIVYFPLHTDLLRLAANRGCKTSNGAGMAVHQAAGAFELITGRKAVVDRISQSFETLCADAQVQIKECSP